MVDEGGRDPSWCEYTYEHWLEHKYDVSLFEREATQRQSNDTVDGRRMAESRDMEQSSESSLSLSMLMLGYESDMEVVRWEISKEVEWFDQCEQVGSIQHQIFLMKDPNASNLVLGTRLQHLLDLQQFQRCVSDASYTSCTVYYWAHTIQGSFAYAYNNAYPTRPARPARPAQLTTGFIRFKVHTDASFSPRTR
jgi:hypothetical protein